MASLIIIFSPPNHCRLGKVESLFRHDDHHHHRDRSRRRLRPPLELLEKARCIVVVTCCDEENQDDRSWMPERDEEMNHPDVVAVPLGSDCNEDGDGGCRISAAAAGCEKGRCRDGLFSFRTMKARVQNHFPFPIAHCRAWASNVINVSFFVILMSGKIPQKLTWAKYFGIHISIHINFRLRHPLLFHSENPRVSALSEPLMPHHSSYST